MTRHDWACLDPDDGSVEECVCGLDDPQPEPWPDYSDPLLDREPMGGDPYWRDGDG